MIIYYTEYITLHKEIKNKIQASKRGNCSEIGRMTNKDKVKNMQKRIREITGQMMHSH